MLTFLVLFFLLQPSLDEFFLFYTRFGRLILRLFFFRHFPFTGFGANKNAKDVTSSMKQLNINKDGQASQQQQGPPPPPPIKIKHKGLNVPMEYLNARDAGRRKLNAANFVVIGELVF